MLNKRHHKCMDHRERAARDGDDVLTEHCTVCRKVRYEADGVRPMAWYVDASNPTGHRYAHPNPPSGPTVWKVGR